MLHALTRHRVPSVTYSTWSTTNHSTDTTLADAGQSVVCAGTATGGLCIGSTSKTTGKFYVEMLCVNAGATSGPYSGQYTPAFGLHLSPYTLSNYLGQSANGFGSWAQGSIGTNRNTYNNATASYAGLPSPPHTATGQVGRMAVDVGAGKLWLSYWGQSAWLGGGDPASGTTPTYTFTGGSTTYFASCPRCDTAKIQIVSPLAFNFPAPSGFGVWT